MRVLLIEDDSATAQSMELMLKSESFNVYTTDLGEEGMSICLLRNNSTQSRTAQATGVASNRVGRIGKQKS